MPKLKRVSLRFCRSLLIEENTIWRSVHFNCHISIGNLVVPSQNTQSCFLEILETLLRRWSQMILCVQKRVSWVRVKRGLAAYLVALIYSPKHSMFLLLTLELGNVPFINSHRWNKFHHRYGIYILLSVILYSFRYKTPIGSQALISINSPSCTLSSLSKTNRLATKILINLDKTNKFGRDLNVYMHCS